jgi:Protein of unknown function (DUF3102)
VHDIVVPTLTGQVTPSLSKFVTAIRNAHAAVRAALSNAVTCAIAAGDNLAEAKRTVGHGHWTEFLHSCGINERTARRYIQLAELAKSNRSRTTDLPDLTDLPIESAIKKLSPPKSLKNAKGSTLTTKTAIARTTAADVLALWNRASQDERTKALNCIGLEALFGCCAP